MEGKEWMEWWTGFRVERGGMLGGGVRMGNMGYGMVEGRWRRARRTGAKGLEGMKVAEVAGWIRGGRNVAPVVKWYDISLPQNGIR